MGDLILQTRLDALEANLLQVQQVLQAVQQRREEVEQLDTHLSHSMKAALQVQDEIARATISLKAREAERLSEDLEVAKRQIVNVIKAIQTAQDKAVIPMTTRLLQINEKEDLGLTVNTELVRGSELLLEKLGNIRTLMKQAMDKEQEDDQQAAHVLRQQAWQGYMGQISTGTQPIFAEYVDFLRGLALRDAGFDAGICYIADELIRLTGKGRAIPSWESFTILAREEDVELTLARIIRLRFPEWSIWTLPLVAHEFCYLVATNTLAAELRQCVENDTTDEWPAPHLQHYLADAFTTYTMGPAYACAAILLRFKPQTAFEDTPTQPAAIKRAHVILSMLDWMSNKARPYNPPYLSIIKTLRKEWDAALGQVAPTIPFDNVETAQLKQQKEILQEWVQVPLSEEAATKRSQQRKKLQEWAQFIGEFLYEKTLGYSVSAWENIFAADWPQKLLQNEAIGVSGEEDLRDVLNAAWLSRLKLQDPKKIGEVAQAAEKLGKQILALSLRRTPSSGGSAQTRQTW